MKFASTGLFVTSQRSLLFVAGAMTAGIGLLSASIGASHADAQESHVSSYEEHDGSFENFRFHCGEILPTLRLHYVTLGRPLQEDGQITNAVVLLHGTTGCSKQFLTPSFASAMFGPGQPLDAAKYYIIIPDGIGHGGSSRPSEGLRAKFPRYGYRDMVEAYRALVVEKLGIKRSRLILGTSMGGMHAWLWGTLYPDDMDALMPVACLPAPVAGRNLYWRRVITTAIQNDPSYRGGNYGAQPPALAAVWPVFKLMTDGPDHFAEEAATPEQAESLVRQTGVEAARLQDANDVLYEFLASSDYDPSGNLAKIKAHLLTVNFADDELNRPGFAELERAIVKVRGARSVIIETSKGTQGHSTLRLAKVWGSHVAEIFSHSK